MDSFLCVHVYGGGVMQRHLVDLCPGRMADDSPRASGKSHRWRAAAAAYLVWLAYTYKDKNKLGEWGYSSLTRMIFNAFGLVFDVAGISPRTVSLPPELLHQMATGEATPCIVTVSPHGAFAIGHVCISQGDYDWTQSLLHSVDVRLVRLSCSRYRWCAS